MQHSYSVCRPVAGTSIGDCSLTELKRLLETLKIDIGKLSVKSHHDGNKAFPDVELPCTESSDHYPLAPTSSRHPNQNRRGDGQEDALEQLDDDAEGGTAHEEMMMQIAPEVQMFLGNHFLASDKGEDDDVKTGSGVNNGENRNLATSSRPPHKQFRAQNGEVTPSNSQQQSGSSSFQQHFQQPNVFQQQQGDTPEETSKYTCRLCGKVSGNGASLFAHLLYPHYAHLWREEVPHRAARYECKDCPYSTAKRQHFVMHVARVHDELKKKLVMLGENLEVLDNLTQKSHNGNNERIVSSIAKGVSDDTNFPPHSTGPAAGGGTGGDGEQSSSSFHEGGFGSGGGGGSPNAKDFFNAMGDLDGDRSSPHKLFSGFDNTAATSAAIAAAAAANSGGGLVGRLTRGYKPVVKCRLCGKSWKGKDNFFTHLVSTHFKYLWAEEVPKSADMFHCHVKGCQYQSKYRYNFLFHLAGKHKQLRQKLAEEGIPQNVLVPIETDGSNLEEPGMSGDPEQMSAALLAAGMSAGGLVNPSDLLQQSKMLMQQQLMTPPSAVKHTGGGSSGGNSTGRPNQNNTRLICRVCSKVSLNHTCHRQHVVGKHFNEFWAHLTSDNMGIFNCHHPDCTYKTPNRSVFIIHLAYVHQELKTKLIASGKDPNCATPDVYGKRKYRRNYYDNTQRLAGIMSDSGGRDAAHQAAAAAATAAAVRNAQNLSNLVSQNFRQALVNQFEGATNTMMQELLESGSNNASVAGASVAAATAANGYASGGAGAEAARTAAPSSSAATGSSGAEAPTSVDTPEQEEEDEEEEEDMEDEEEMVEEEDEEMVSAEAAAAAQGQMSSEVSSAGNIAW